MNHQDRKSNSGFTIIELIISVFILSIVVITATSFQRDVFSLNYSLQGNLNAQIEARRVVRVMIAELRKASPSSLGAYPIASASSTAITFYSDLDSNGTKERVRYFVSGNEVRRGVIIPTGNPAVYNSGSETLTTVISGFVSSSTLPLFQYYPSTYSGTSTAMSYPLDIPAIRLIKITAIINKDPAHNPAPFIITSQVNLRNLKDNL